MKLYQEELMDHYRHPRHRGTLQRPDFSTGEYNPSCGDSVSVQGNIKQNELIAIAFEGAGCVISQAAASLLAEYALNRSLDELAALTADDILKLVKIPLGPTRLKCALLSLHALKEGIKQYKQKNSE